MQQAVKIHELENPDALMGLALSALIRRVKQEQGIATINYLFHDDPEEEFRAAMQVIDNDVEIEERWYRSVFDAELDMLCQLGVFDHPEWSLPQPDTSVHSTMQPLTDREVLMLAADYEEATGHSLLVLVLDNEDGSEPVRYIPQAQGVEPREFATLEGAYRYMLTELGA